eukprot:6028768-Prymnesium_polylepis.1
MSSAHAARHVRSHVQNLEVAHSAGVAAGQMATTAMLSAVEVAAGAAQAARQRYAERLRALEAAQHALVRQAGLEAQLEAETGRARASEATLRALECATRTDRRAAEALHEAQLLAARASLATANAKLTEADARAARCESALGAALRRLDEFDHMPSCIHRIGRALLEDRIGAFERTLLEQLGANAWRDTPAHESIIVQLVGLVATGDGPAAARLLHDNAPNLFPGESTWRAELRKGRRPPVLNRALEGLVGALEGLEEHLAHWLYTAPLVFAHDSTAVRPYADVRAVDKDHVEVDCFVTGPVRLPRTAEGAHQLRELLNSSTPKAALGTLLTLVPYADGTGIPPFVVALVAGGGPDRAETEAWEDGVVRAAAARGWR